MAARARRRFFSRSASSSGPIARTIIVAPPAPRGGNGNGVSRGNGRFLRGRGAGLGQMVGRSFALLAGAGLSVGYDVITQATKNETDDNPYFSAGLKLVTSSIIRWVAPKFSAIADGIEADGYGSSMRRTLFRGAKPEGSR